MRLKKDGLLESRVTYPILFVSWVDGLSLDVHFNLSINSAVLRLNAIFHKRHTFLVSLRDGDV